MRILTIVDGLGPGGTERVAQNCAVAYARAGHESAVLAYSGGGAREAPIRAGGVEVFVGGPGTAGIRAAIGRARDWRPDVVHAHRPGRGDGLGSLVRELETTARLPVVETSHFGRADFSADRHRIDVHVQVSSWCMWQWRRWTSWQRPRPIGVIVPHMVHGGSFFPDDRERAMAFRDAHGIPRDATLFGRVGQSYDTYFPDALFEAFSRAAEPDERMWLAAVGAPECVDLQIARLKPGVRARVRRVAFLSGDEALRACYSAFDAFLHVTRIGESFGLVLCESMLCGVPVVTMATPVKGNAQVEVVGHERGGLVAADVPAVARCMKRLADDPRLASDLGQRGREWVLRELDPSRITGMLLTVLRLALEHRDRSALQRSLAAHPELRQAVGDAEVRALLRRMEGRIGVSQRVTMRLATNPALYRAYEKLRWSGAATGTFRKHQ
jgi:glycosyltransferase involved in cell wall biosynthesis